MVIYNHHFPANIEPINRLYDSRFSEICHLLPFPVSADDSAKSVGRSSHHFQGYVYDAREELLSYNCDRYLFIADDLLLNPSVSESTLDELFGLSGVDDVFISELKPLSDLPGYWSHAEGALRFEPRSAGLDIRHAIPSFDEAREMLKSHGVFSEKVNSKAFFRSGRHRTHYRIQTLFGVLNSWVCRALGIVATTKPLQVTQPLLYPLAYGYSDIFLVPRGILPNFARLCGAFAAAGLFVEIALPTALALSSGVIRTQSDSPLGGGPLWGKDVEKLKLIAQDLDSLLERFPHEWLFVHPVKLSEWQTQ